MTVHVVGNATLDITYRLARLPAPGETLLADGRAVDAGGKGLNQALAAARAGAMVRLVAAIGADPAAAVLRRRLDGEPRLQAILLEAPHPSDESVIMVAADGENAIVSTHACAAWLTAERAEAALGPVAAGDTLLLQGNLSLATTRACLARAREAGARTVLNPAPLHDDVTPLLPLADIVVVNRVEALTIAGGADPRAAARRLGTLGAGTVLLTLGAEGCIAFDAGVERHHPAPRVAVVDTAGAGDVFTGTLVAALARRRPLDWAVALAVAAAAIAVTRRGTSAAFPSEAEIAALLPRLEEAR